MTPAHRAGAGAAARRVGPDGRPLRRWSPARRAASASRPPCGWPGSVRTCSSTAATRAAARPRSRPCAPRPSPGRRRRCISPTSARSPTSAVWPPELRRDRPRLDVLVANAGVYCARAAARRADGLELTFAVNVVAPVLLAAELLPALRAAAPARVVVLSSASHWTGEIHWDDLQLAAPGAYDPLRAYDQSKLAVLMLTLALARRLEGSGVSAVCLDPGDVATTMLASGWPGPPGHRRRGRRRDQRVSGVGAGRRRRLRRVLRGRRRRDAAGGGARRRRRRTASGPRSRR